MGGQGSGRPRPKPAPPTPAQAEAMTRFKSTFGSKLWRLQHLYKIRVKKMSLVPFKPNNIQQRIIGFVDEHFLSKLEPIRAFFLKFRQGGVSTLWMLWYLDDAIWNPNMVCGVLSHKLDSLKALTAIMRTAYLSMPDALKPPLEKDNADELVFGHGKRVNGHYVEASRMFVSLNIRSTPANKLHVSEHAHCKQADISASMGAVPPDGDITAETTAAGMNHAYEVYSEGKAIVKKGGPLEPGVLKSAFYSWPIQDEYRLPVPPGFVVHRNPDEKRFAARAKAEYGIDIDDEQILYRRKLIKDHKDLRAQEFPENDDEAFLASGRKFFDAEKVMVLMSEAIAYLQENPAVEATDDYVMFERPRPRHVYVAGADCSGGKEGDYSVLKIIDVTTKREVFVLKGHFTPAKFYKLCDKWAKFFNNALLCVESNNHGHAVLLGLQETCRYPNLFFVLKGAKKSMTRIVTGPQPAKDEREYGWTTNNKTRPLMLDQLKFAVEGESDENLETFEPAWLVLDIEMLREMLTFIEREGKFEADQGKHDDHIMATAIAHQMFLRMAPRVANVTQETKAEPREFRVQGSERPDL